MSIQDIIEAARRISTTAEEATDVGVPGWQDVLDDADTILAHGPELALMEAVCEAASKVEFYTSDDGWDRMWLGARETREAYASLQAYRKERGL